jgi:hypothetical protein
VSAGTYDKETVHFTLRRLNDNSVRELEEIIHDMEDVVGEVLAASTLRDERGCTDFQITLSSEYADASISEAKLFLSEQLQAHKLLL